jgi:hypothetical protein
VLPLEKGAYLPDGGEEASTYISPQAKLKKFVRK